MNFFRPLIVASFISTFPAGGVLAKSGCDIDALPDLLDVELRFAVIENAPAQHCKISGVIGTETNFELLLPDEWNGKFAMGGGAGFTGFVVNTSLTYGALQSGYATVGTDTGHQGHPLDASWALNNLERVVSFGHKAVHRTALTAKALTRAYYGQDISRSYFTGCSRGGGQGLMEAQRYPEDFDGIVAGAPANNWTMELGARNTRLNAAMYPDPNDLSIATIGPDAQSLIGTAVMAQCNTLDGIRDGILNNPAQCDFDVASLACGVTNSNMCLSDQELDAAKAIYDDLLINGERVLPGFPAGAELYPDGWAKWLTGGLSLGDVGEFQEGVAAESDDPAPVAPSAHFAFGNGVMKYLIFNDTDWNYTKFNSDTFVFDAATAEQTLNATDPDLDAFRARGGKLLMYTGWGDMALTPYGTIDYYDSVLERDPSAASDTRLFMMPGVAHCFGGKGPDWVNYLNVIDNWFETGDAPNQLTAFWLNDHMQPEGGRPVCAYPTVLTYDGSGDPRVPTSFICQAPYYDKESAR